MARVSLAAVLPVLLLQACCARHVSNANCTLTNRPPRKARYLKFCQDYNSLACCIPGHDLENQVQFENLIEGLGPGCKNPMMYPEVRFFYCLGCDPDEPHYRTGSTIRICQSFLDKLWRDPAYEECGVMFSNPCPDSSWDFDPYQCGDTLQLPKQVYNNDPVAFINAFKPPGLDGITFVAVDGAHSRGRRRSTWRAPDVRRPIRARQRARLAHAPCAPRVPPSRRADTTSPPPGTVRENCWTARTYSRSSAPRTASAASWGATAALALAAAALLHVQR